MSISEIIRVEADSASEQPGPRWHAAFEKRIEGINQESPLSVLGGELLAFSFSGACLYSMRSDMQLLSRSRAAPRNRFSPMVILPIEGDATLSQFGRECSVEPGQFILMDSAAPFQLTYTAEFRHLFLNLPPTSFAPAMYHQAVCAAASRSTKFDENFVSLVGNVWECAENLEPDEHGSALNSILSLIQLTTPLRLPAKANVPCVRVRRAMAYIEHNLAAEWLTPQSIADAQHVSRRYLDELFGRIGLRIERWIWERRLIRAREELQLSVRTRRSCNKSIIQVALDTGFKSPSHFSRAFSSRFGVSPREFKQGVAANTVTQH